MQSSAAGVVRRQVDGCGDTDATSSVALLAEGADQSGTWLRLEVSNIPPQAALAIRERRAHVVIVLDETGGQVGEGAPRLRLVARQGEASPEKASGAPSALFRRARDYIQSHSGDPELSPEKVAAAMGVSRASLYRSFRIEGGVADFIRRARLEAARAALQNAGDRRRIGEIAFAFGFLSDAHFSRAFRSAFSVSPTELRRSRVADAGA